MLFIHKYSYHAFLTHFYSLMIFTIHVVYQGILVERLGRYVSYGTGTTLYSIRQNLVTILITISVEVNS